MPAAVSFTVETDGRLLSGESLAYAIQQTDDAPAGHAA
jgi:homocysteine S-methyltransferase